MKKRSSLLTAAVICLTSAVPAGVTAAGTSARFTSSFIQNWYCRDWTAERWEEEFSAAKSAGFDSLILQSTFDIVRGKCMGEKQDPAAYPSAESFCMFPCSTGTNYLSSQNSGDALELALKAAKATDMQLWLGTVNDDMWWNFGLGAPTSYFENWCADNAELSSGLITEIWERYGDDYGEQIAGWYYMNEVWNLNSAGDASDCDTYASVIGANIKASVDAIDRACPEKPLMISPFYNIQLSDKEQFGSFISAVVTAAGFRPYDIYAPQDGGGRNYTPDVIREWTEAQKNALNGRMRFWVNNECFGPDLTAKPFDEFRRNYASTSDLAEGNIIFSWNHYYADNTQFKDFSTAVVKGDADLDGEFTVADLVLFHKWLIGGKDVRLTDWRAADLNGDGRLDAFDEMLMRRLLFAEKGSA